MFNVEGRETHICIYCWAVGLRETKPINFGSHKAEGDETNTGVGVPLNPCHFKKPSL